MVVSSSSSLKTLSFLSGAVFEVVLLPVLPFPFVGNPLVGFTGMIGLSEGTGFTLPCFSTGVLVASTFFLAFL